MDLSDQEEQLTNPAETPESGEFDSPQGEGSSVDSGMEPTAEDFEAPGAEDENQDDSPKTSLETAESETLTQPDEELGDESPTSSEPAADQPLESDQVEVEDSLDEPAVQLEPVPEVDAVPDKPGEESVELDLSFLDEDQTGAAEEEEQDGRSWYVVHCYSGYENKVRHNLEQRIETMGMKNMIFDIVVPTEEEIEVKEGKRRTVERRVFPGYILVNMIMTEESWYVVRNTPGVTGFVGMGNTPTPLRPEEVSQIIKRMEAEAPRIKVTFKSGERVRIVDGPFNDFRGTVSEIDMERAKVRVMVNFFGRETPVELDFLQVEKT